MLLGVKRTSLELIATSGYDPYAPVDFALGTPSSTDSPAGFRRGGNGVGREVRLDIAEGAPPCLFAACRWVWLGKTIWWMVSVDQAIQIAKREHALVS